MRDMRIALCNGYEMKISENRKIRIADEAGRGARCIVYDAIYWDQMQIKHKIRVRECYPAYIQLTRAATGELVPSGNPEKFEKAKNRFTDAYKRNTDIRNTLGLTNSTVNAVDVISCNHTVYILLPMDEGIDYRYYEDQSLQELFRHMKSLAQIIQKYHQKGYLHLDIKPENVLILPETPEHVILFDFDSVTAIGELQKNAGIPYSDGFSAPEQMQGKIKKIGFHSDVYSIGAMLFFKLFVRKPCEADCRIASSYSFEKMRYGSEKYQPKLYKMLDLFLKKTLSIATAPRWHEMQKVIDALDELIKLADINDVYLLDSFQYNSACFVGRQDDLEEINELLAKNQLVFLSGIGGIGKTELAKQYAYRHRAQYDTVVFAVYEKNIESLVRDEIGINQISREEDETERDYFKRKIEVLKQAATPKDLIIIDNFDVDADEDLETLFACPCKFIITTRKDFRDYNYEQINVDRIKDIQEILNLFYTYTSIPYTEKEVEAVRQLIEYVEHHTMTVELIAKYLRNTEISPEILYQKFLEKDGVTNTQEVQIRQRKDRKLRSESVNSHLKILFDISGFDVIEREIIASLSLFDGIRISRSQFEILLCGIKETAEKLDGFIQNGWVIWNKVTGKISLHQVIQDLIYHELVPDADNCRHIVAGMNEYLSVEPEVYAQHDIREKMAAIFIKRLTGNNMSYAWLCFRAGDEEKLQEAEKICLGQGDTEAYDLLQRIERKRIKMVNDSIEIDWSATDYPESAMQKLDEMAGHLDSAVAYCRKSSENPDYLVREYFEMASETSDMLDDRVEWCAADVPIPQMENLYEKISQLFDLVMEQMPLTSYMPKEKEKAYQKIRDYYSKDPGLTYRGEFRLNLKKGYQYQELLNQLREDTSFHEIDDGNNMSYAELAEEYENNGKEQEAIACYQKVYEEDFATMEGICIPESREYAAKSIAEIYRKKGDIDSAIQTLEGAFSDTESEDICIELIGILKEHQKLQKARQYAIQLRQRMDPAPENAYDTGYMLAACYFLYSIEENKTEKTQLWKECLKYYKMLGTNEIEEHCGDFLVEYIQKETSSMEEVLSVIDRVREYGKNNIRKTILWNVIKKYEGKNHFEKNQIICLIRLAELSKEYRCKNIKEGLELCNQAQDIYNKYDLNDAFLQSLIYKTREELMNEGNFDYEQITQIRKMCNYRLLAEKQIAQKKYTPEEQIEIWKEAANQYSYIEDGEKEEECLKEAIKIAEKTWEKIEASEFWTDYSSMQHDLVTLEIDNGKLETAEQNLALLYDKTAAHILEKNVKEDTTDHYWDIDYIAFKYEDIANINETIRIYLAALYILLEKKPDSKILTDRQDGIGQLCVVLQQLLEKEYDSDVTNSIIEAKRHLQEFLEDTAYDQERVLLLLQKIAEKYQYKDFEFKHDIRQK